MSSNLNPAINNDKTWNLGNRRAGDSFMFTDATYNTDGTLSTAVIDGNEYTFSYLNGKIANVTGGGVTKIYAWSGDHLVSIEVA